MIWKEKGTQIRQFHSKYLPNRPFKKSTSVQKTNKIAINGHGELDGAEADQVTISGSGTVKGDVRSNEFTSNGHSSVEGGIYSKMIKINGFSESKGEVVSEKIELNGFLKAPSVDCERLEINGVLSTDQLFAKEVNFPHHFSGNIRNIFSIKTTITPAHTTFHQLMEFIPKSIQEFTGAGKFLG